MSGGARDQNEAAAVFREVTGLLEREDVEYAVGGGLATDHWTGRTPRIRDIDLVIRENDAPRLLHLLEGAGYGTSEMEHSWLHKASKGDVTIDLMFELKNGTRFDEAFRSRRQKGEMFGTTVHVIAPEDQVASLAGTIDRQTIGQHWYSMIDIMANNDVDWDYLVTRARRVPLQMLSVVFFALSERVPIQKGVIERLMELATAVRD